MLTEIVRHRDRFFQDHAQIRRVVYFNLNARDTGVDHPWTGDCGGTRAKIDRDYHTVDDPDDFDDSDRREPDQTNPLGLEVTSLNLEDLKDLGSILRPRDIVVLDDLLQLTEEVQFLLKYGVHHLKLYLFVVTQTCLSSPLYSLIQSIHNLLLIFGNTATTRLAQHVVQTFFLCSDTKAYLKAIFAISEKQQDTVVLKLNSVASYRPHSNVLALSRVQSLFESDPPHCFVYPELGREDKLDAMPRASSSHEAGAEIPKLDGEFLEEAFVLLPANRVRMISDPSASRGGNDDEDDDDDQNPGRKGRRNDADHCLKEKRQRWDEMALFLEREIESSFPLKRWAAAKNLTRELLRCNELCVSSDFRTVFPSKKPKWKFGIVDFINVASRKSGPGERASDKVLQFRPLVDILLRHDLPETFIVNKLLLSGNASRAGRAELDPGEDWGPGFADADDDPTSADFDPDEDDRFGYPRRRRGGGGGRGGRRLLRLWGRGSRRFGNRGPGRRGFYRGGYAARYPDFY